MSPGPPGLGYHRLCYVCSQGLGKSLCHPCPRTSSSCCWSLGACWMDCLHPLMNPHFMSNCCPMLCLCLNFRYYPPLPDSDRLSNSRQSSYNPIIEILKFSVSGSPTSMSSKWSVLAASCLLGTSNCLTLLPVGIASLYPFSEIFLEKEPFRLSLGVDIFPDCLVWVKISSQMLTFLSGLRSIPLPINVYPPVWSSSWTLSPLANFPQCESSIDLFEGSQWPAWKLHKWMRWPVQGLYIQWLDFFLVLHSLEIA